MPFLEFPKWLHHPDHASVLVQNAEAEAEQLAAWGSASKPVEPPVAHEEVETPEVAENALVSRRKPGRPRKAQ